MARYTTTGQAPGAVSGEPWVTNPVHFESREGTGDVKPLPKPPRVEKWQRWLNTALGDEALVNDLKRDPDGQSMAYLSCGVAKAHTMLVGHMWHFLGYVKPPTVEVGQRWRCEEALSSELRNGVMVARVDKGEPEAVFESGHRVMMHSMIVSPGWEYLGMGDEAAAEGAAIDKAVEQVAIVTGQPKGSVRVAIEDIRERYSPNMLERLVLGGFGQFATMIPPGCEAKPPSTERLGELFESVKAPPTLGGMPFPYDGPIEVSHGSPTHKHYSVAFVQSRTDHKAEARRALEATAKRLLDNPPAWAYPTGWMMAVLHHVEQRLSAARLAREFSPAPCFYGSVYEDLRTYQANRSAGQPHDMAKAGLSTAEVCDAYARGMDIRAKPLLVRPVGIGRVR